MKFSHINIVARDADKLADFYKAVFGCKENSQREIIKGEKPMRAMGLSSNQFYGAWLSLPGVVGPYLESFQFKESHLRLPLRLLNLKRDGQFEAAKLKMIEENLRRGNVAMAERQIQFLEQSKSPR